LKNYNIALSTEALPRATPETTQEQFSELPNLQKLLITLVNATTFLRACKAQGAIPFQLLVKSSLLKGRAAHLTKKTPNLTDVPLEYQQFADVFCKSKSKLLPEHCSFNLAIQLEDSATPPPWTHLLLVQLGVTDPPRVH